MVPRISTNCRYSAGIAGWRIYTIEGQLPLYLHKGTGKNKKKRKNDTPPFFFQSKIVRAILKSTIKQTERRKKTFLYFISDKTPTRNVRTCVWVVCYLFPHGGEYGSAFWFFREPPHVRARISFFRSVFFGRVASISPPGAAPGTAWNTLFTHHLCLHQTEHGGLCRDITSYVSARIAAGRMHRQLSSTRVYREVQASIKIVRTKKK